MMKLIDLVTEGVLVSCLSDIVIAKLEVDSNNFGGVMLERDLAAAMRKAGHYVYTQRQIETLQNSGIQFDFGVDWNTFKRNQKDITSDVYASDLFLFTKQNEVLVLVDSVSLKTSINDNDASKVFIANDAEGVVYDSVVNDDTNLTLGQVLIISLNTDSLSFEANYFDGVVEDIVRVFKTSTITEEKVSYNLKNSVFKGRSREVLSIVNRNAVTGKKQTSFNRGVQIRRDFLSDLSEIGVFKSICKGKICVHSDSLVDNLLTLG